MDDEKKAKRLAALAKAREAKKAKAEAAKAAAKPQKVEIPTMEPPKKAPAPKKVPAKKAEPVPAPAPAPEPKKRAPRKKAEPKISAGMDDTQVSITLKEFIKEHKTLIRELQDARPSLLKAEAQKQAAELARVTELFGRKKAAPKAEEPKEAPKPKKEKKVKVEEPKPKEEPKEEPKPKKEEPKPKKEEPKEEPKERLVRRIRATGCPLLDRLPTGHMTYEATRAHLKEEKCPHLSESESESSSDEE